MNQHHLIGSGDEQSDIWFRLFSGLWLSKLELLTVKAAGKRTIFDKFVAKQLPKFGGNRLNFLYGNKRHPILLPELLTLITKEPTDSIDTGKEAYLFNPS